MLPQRVLDVAQEAGAKTEVAAATDAVEEAAEVYVSGVSDPAPKVPELDKVARKGPKGVLMQGCHHNTYSHIR